MKINITENKNEKLFLPLNEELNLTLSNNSSCVLNLSIFSANKPIKIHADLNENSNLEIVCADFSNGSFIVDSEINLNASDAKANWKLASLSTNKDIKKFNVSFNHNHPKTFASMDNFGVALDNSFLTFSGVNHILENAYKSQTNQNAKIIVFDKDARGKADPILKIDNNDVLASHSAIVGRLNDDHLFYLQSRGLTDAEAKALIIRGYLAPIAQRFPDNLRSKMENIIEEKCHV